jgi:tRNA1(Val) A37 N6-methylase TrmN6
VQHSQSLHFCLVKIIKGAKKQVVTFKQPLIIHN